MNHEMNLQPEPFENIKNGSKTIERRLNDPKRQLLKIGDTITFRLAQDQNQKLETRIIDLVPFKSFTELYKNFPSHLYGITPEDAANHMSAYYSKEDEEKWGVLAIKIELM